MPTPYRRQTERADWCLPRHSVVSMCGTCLVWCVLVNHGPDCSRPFIHRFTDVRSRIPVGSASQARGDGLSDSEHGDVFRLVRALTQDPSLETVPMFGPFVPEYLPSLRCQTLAAAWLNKAFRLVPRRETTTTTTTAMRETISPYSMAVAPRSVSHVELCQSRQHVELLTVSDCADMACPCAPFKGHSHAMEAASTIRSALGGNRVGTANRLEQTGRGPRSRHSARDTTNVHRPNAERPARTRQVRISHQSKVRIARRVKIGADRLPAG
jgi:hypothetical protein